MTPVSVIRVGRRQVLAAGAALLAFGALAAPAAAAGEVNVYSYRQEVLIRPLLDAFTKSSGIKVNVVYVKDAGIERLKAEGKASPADAVLTVDVANLVQLEKAGLLQGVRSAAIEQNIPAQYRHPEGKWFGLAMRARIVVYNPAKVKPEELSTYEDLASAKWAKRICVRSSGHSYNLALVSSLIAANGAAKTQEWAAAFAKNLARNPTGGDRDQIKAVAAGVCDIGIVNSYYLAGMLGGKDAEAKKTAQAVKPFFPNQAGRGTHVNISGAAVTISAKNKDNAVKLIEYLSSDAAQAIYADKVFEYPIKPGTEPSAILAGFGKFKADALPLAKLGDLRAEALKIVDRAGWR
ncbi:MAG: Fe(3+) ABC transporter substrate-binding protein [Rhodospirillaceae bacterium]|nr:Fe(3+) ABC transporter substrate-binding protein [Rhodospirillaceae bacterium]